MGKRAPGRAGWSRPLAVTLAALLLLAAGGCRLEMYDQAHVRPLRPSTFYGDSLSARPFIPGTVGRGESGADSIDPVSNGGATLSGMVTDRADQEKAALGADGLNASIPMPVTRVLLMRGRQRYDIYCSPCHGRLGDGQGMIVQRGLVPPPSFHIDRLRQAPDAHFYDVITNGFGIMYSYAARVAPDDRWAIAAYIRALQMSQNATVQDVPLQEQKRLQGE
ncbi:MAG: hypothetical protein JWQ98_1632 [Chlorobi bacterium]|nr:hypothetical protein [Chlorobiota bacterium]